LPNGELLLPARLAILPSTKRQAVEFGVEIGEYEGVVRVPRRVFQRLLAERPTPERCVEAYYLQRTRFERVPSANSAGAY
jgi:hypothetical protein